jgi:hypothetical protein
VAKFQNCDGNLKKLKMSLFLGDAGAFDIKFKLWLAT